MLHVHVVRSGVVHTGMHRVTTIGHLRGLRIGVIAHGLLLRRGCGWIGIVSSVGAHWLLRLRGTLWGLSHLSRLRWCVVVRLLARLLLLLLLLLLGLWLLHVMTLLDRYPLCGHVALGSLLRHAIVVHVLHGIHTVHDVRRSGSVGNVVVIAGVRSVVVGSRSGVAHRVVTGHSRRGR